MTSPDRTRQTTETEPATDPAEAPPGARGYADAPVRGRRQGAGAPGASEPGSMGEPEPRGGAADGDPGGRERPRPDGSGYRGG